MQKSHASIPGDFQKVLDEGYEPFAVSVSSWVYFKRLKPCEECGDVESDIGAIIDRGIKMMKEADDKPMNYNPLYQTDVEALRREREEIVKMVEDLKANDFSAKTHNFKVYNQALQDVINAIKERK